MLTSNPLQPGQKIGLARFTLIRQLGQGGMGVVWLAQDERLGESVALKFLPPEVRADPVALDDLRRETARSQRLAHPNIIRIHDLHEPEGEPAFISMEYVEGPTLSALRLQRPDRVMHWDELRPIVQQLCAALDYAHSEGVIHRDLKPANLMLDSKERLKLADFGIAAVVSDSVSRVSAQKTSGTLAYMSPQQLTGKRPSVGDDIYSLGATLYELLTSKPPFFTGDLTHQILHEPTEPLDERLTALEIDNPIPADVAALVMACLAKESGQRPRSAQAVAAWIGLELGSQPSLASLGQEVLSEPQPVEAMAGSVAEEAAPAQPGSNRKLLWAGVALAVFGLLGLVVWYGAIRGHRTRLTKDRTQTFDSSASKAPVNMGDVQPTTSAAEAPTAAAPRAAISPPKRLLLVTVTKGFRHSSIATGKRILAELAGRDGRFVLDDVDDDQAMATKMTAAALLQYDGAIFLNTTGDLPLPDKPAFLLWIASGKGFVGIHAAIDTFRGKVPLDPFIQMLGAEYKGHGPQATVECLNQDPTHPACRQLGARWTIHDEIYLLNGFNPRNVHRLLGLDKEPNQKTPGDFPIAWCKDYGQGKVFFSSLGHRDEVWESAAYQKHLSGGIRWALGLEAGDAAPDKTVTPRPNWISLFDGKTLSGWTAPDPGDWRVGTDGSITSQGPPSHLFSPGTYTNVEFKAQVKLGRGANGGMFFRAQLEKGNPKGYEAQAYNGNAGMITGSLYNFKEASARRASDETWFTQHIVAIGNRIVIKVNDMIVVDYTDPNSTYFSGHLALQHWNPAKADTSYRNAMVKPLPADEAAAWAEARNDMPDIGR
jgi:type 1 glutamine amidotransferase